MRKFLILGLLSLSVSCAGIQKHQSGDRADLPTYVHPKGTVEVTILVEPKPGSATSSYMGYAVFHPGAKIPRHNHPNSEEYLYFISGTGKVLVEGREERIQPGMAIHFPKGVDHEFANDGDEDVIAVQVYTPSGPEQRFKKWPVKP